MGFFKCLGYVAAGVGAVVLAPATGGSSIALAIGALGTTTAAGAAIGVGIGATAAAVDHAVTSREEVREESYRQGVAAGNKAGEAAAKEKYQSRINDLVERLKQYLDTDQKLIGLYAVGLSVANSDGVICEEETLELEAFVSGCMASHMPPHFKEIIAELKASPPTFEQAINFARKARLSKQDIDDVVDVVANADGHISFSEEIFIDKWKRMAVSYEFA